MSDASDGRTHELRLTAAVVDLQRGVVVRDGSVVRLTPVELKLLRYLAARSPAAASRAELQTDVWEYRAGVDSHTVLSTMHRVRRKIERDPKQPDHLVTEPGRGYALLLPPPTPGAREPYAPTLPFFGHAETLASALAAVEAGGLTTLVGPGGVGKTRLAHELMAALAARATWTFCVCGLGQAQSEADLEHALAAALGVHLMSGVRPLDAVTHALSGLTRPLLVLDTLEQILAPARTAIARLVATVPGLVVLATSREALGLPYEKVLAVKPLMAREAEALFVDRHRRAAPDAPALSPADLSAIVAACEHLPLALELTAARGRLLSPRELLRRFDEVIVRGATLEASIRWSWNLLTEPAKTLLARLAGFVAGFGIDAVLGVGADLSAIDLLDELVRKSLVTAQLDTSRFTISASVRTFARFAHAQPEANALASAMWLADAAGAWAHAAERGDLDAIRHATSALVAEAPNLRAATQAALTFDPNLAERLVYAQGPLWLDVGPIEEALAVTTRALGVCRTARLELLRGRLLLALGRVPEAKQALRAAGEDEHAAASVRAEAYDHLTGAFAVGPEAEDALARAVLHYGDSAEGRARASGLRSILAWYRGEVETGLGESEQALRAFEALGIGRRSVQMSLNRGFFLLDAGRHEAALRTLRKGYEAATQAQLVYYALFAKAFIGYVHDDRGDFEDARAAYAEVARVSRRHGRIDVGALALVYEAGLPGELASRIALTAEALALAEAHALHVIEAHAAATWFHLDPTRADLAKRARGLLAEPGVVPSPRREIVQILLGDAIPEQVDKAVLRIARRIAAKVGRASSAAT